MNVKIKILAHIFSIVLFLFGMVVIHVVLNQIPGQQQISFFGALFDRTFIIDVGIVCCGVAFFIEFYMTFKPIEITT